MADLNVVTSRDEEIVYLSKQIEGVYDLLAGVVHAINSLSERLTGDQFTLLIGQENSPRRFVPELRRVVWHPVQSQGEVEWPGADLRDPTKGRSPSPCEVRRALYELPGKSGWKDFGLGPNPPAEHTEQVEPTVPS